jgi:zinc transport system substrate-binding protein
MERKILSSKMIVERKKAVNHLFLIIGFSLLVLAAPFLAEASKIKIVTTVFPLMEFSRSVCGERGEVSLLIPPGAEIHTWNPRPSDIVNLSSADFFVYIGGNLEPWIDDLLDSVKNPELRVLEASRNLPLLENHKHDHQHDYAHGEFDPHIWLDFDLDRLIVDKIAVLLSDMDPIHQSFYQENAASYKEKLQRLHQKYQNGLKECASRMIILGGHSAFGYLAKKYNLEQISLYGLSPDSEPTPRQMVEVVELAKKNRVKVVYFEEYVNDELAHVIAREIGARILVLNPGANLDKDQLKQGVSFFDIMEKNLENLRDGLNCR